MPTASLRIVNRLGLHARAAAKFVACAKRFGSEVQIGHGEQQVDGKSIMNVMLLAAPLGSSIQLTVTGPDEEAAFQALSALIDTGFEEGRAETNPGSGND